MAFVYVKQENKMQELKALVLTYNQCCWQTDLDAFELGCFVKINTLSNLNLQFHGSNIAKFMNLLSATIVTIKICKS